MHYKNIFASLALLSTVAAAPLKRSGWGSFTVQNTCPFPVYFTSVLGAQAAPPAQTIHPGKSHSESYQISTVNGGGLSFKMRSDSHFEKGVLQLETTPNPAMGLIFYDMSIINGDGNIGTNWVLTPDHPDSNCQVTSNASGNIYVHAGEQDKQTHACPIADNMVLKTC